MGVRGFIRALKCSFLGKRCLFCDEEVCAYHQNGNPFIGTEYRKNMESAKKKMEQQGK